MTTKKEVERIWFEVKNMPSCSWGYDGMEDENEKNVPEDESGFVRVSDVLVIIEKHLQRTEEKEKV